MTPRRFTRPPCSSSRPAGSCEERLFPQAWARSCRGCHQQLVDHCRDRLASGLLIAVDAVEGASLVRTHAFHGVLWIVPKAGQPLSPCRRIRWGGAGTLLAETIGLPWPRTARPRLAASGLCEWPRGYDASQRSTAIRVRFTWSTLCPFLALVMHCRVEA